MCKRWYTTVPVIALGALFAFGAQPAAALVYAPQPLAKKVLRRPATATSFTCTEDAITMCLNGGRFEVIADFDTNTGQSGHAHTVRLTDDSGYLWFFSNTNIEAVVKVLNACGLNNHYWVFAGGLTDVHVVLTVTDSITGAAVTYENRQSNPFQPIQDTGALAVCP